MKKQHSSQSSAQCRVECFSVSGVHVRYAMTSFIAVDQKEENSSLGRAYLESELRDELKIGSSNSDDQQSVDETIVNLHTICSRKKAISTEFVAPRSLLYDCNSLISYSTPLSTLWMAALARNV